jgi:hypothetical protein
MEGFFADPVYGGIRDMAGRRQPRQNPCFSLWTLSGSNLKRPPGRRPQTQLTSVSKRRHLNANDVKPPLCRLWRQAHGAVFAICSEAAAAK